MSRCFPFPPPGYERKIKAVDLDILKKEKQREKRHKKEKKDKEKKESKEKLEKEKTDEKRRDKKDRKEKHRDKTNDKEKHREKDKHQNKILLNDEKRTAELPDTHFIKSSDNSKDRKNDKIAVSSDSRVIGVPAYCNGDSFTNSNNLAARSKSFSCFPELGRRSIDEERRNVNHLFDGNIAAEPKNDGRVVNLGWKGVDRKEKEKKKAGLDGRMESLCVSEEARFSGNALGQNSVGLVKLAANCAGPWVDGRDWKDKPAVDGRMDGQAFGRDSKSCGSAFPPNSVGMVQNRVGTMARPVEKNVEQKMEGKERSKELGCDDRKGEKRKERDTEKSIKDKDREKEKKKEEKVDDPQRVHMARMIDSSGSQLLRPTGMDDKRGDFPGPQSSRILNLPRTSNQDGDTLNLGKRKGIGLNGVYDEHISGPNKLARTVASSHPLVENGKRLEPCQDSVVSALGVQRPPMNIKVERTFAPDDTQRPPLNSKVEGMEHKINGIETGPLPRSSQVASKLERKSDVPSKPHPDAKYLSQILSVPKMDEWCEHDDQDWVFSNKRSQTRPEGEPSTVEETPEVWAKALWLPKADMFALPYVIPH